MTEREKIEQYFSKLSKKGRNKITIPVRYDKFIANPIPYLTKYLGDCISKHNENVKNCEILNEIYKSKEDLLYDKVRYDSSEINNKSSENHLKVIVDFKTAFMYGIPLDYSIINAINNDDMQYLNSYFIDCNKASEDIDKAKDLYKYGIAYQMVLPKKVEDMKKEAPFIIENMPVESTCMVYSNDIPSKQLFALVIAEDINELGENENIYNIFMPNRKILLDKDYKAISDEIQILDYNPIVEFTLDDKNRLSIIEIGLEVQKSMNKADSMQLDEMEENVNSFIVYENQVVDEDFTQKFKEFKKQRVLLINTNNPQTPAKVSMISCKSNNDSYDTYYERKKKALYDICTTPQGSGNVTSGGDTGQARLLGNGWESAQNQAQLDQTVLIKFERQIVRIVLNICSKLNGCPINEIGVSDVAIKFNINMSNNLLVKAEALKMMYESNMPPKTILKICSITSDVDGEGNAWMENIEKNKQEEFAKEEIIQKQNDNQNKDINNE